MKQLSILKYALSLLFFSALITSCTKENSEVIEDIVTTYEMEVTLRGVTTTYDAYAAYCNENGIESFSVSNNLLLLGNDAWGSEITDGDFVVHYRKDATSEFSLGGTIIESTIDSMVTKTFTLTDESMIDITIDAANSTEVLGSMSGDFLVFTNIINEEFDLVPFSVTFAGQVDSALTPIFCE